MATAASGRPASARATYSKAEERANGWLVFAASMLGIAGTFSVIDGIVALSRSKFYSANAVYVFSDLRTWGWITLIIGAIAVTAAFGVLSRSQFARWFGMVAAGVNALAQFMFVQAYPFWSMIVFAADVLVIYGLAVYGGREQTD
jgi:hypothetical protein